mgnify:CR=1 FL=1
MDFILLIISLAAVLGAASAGNIFTSSFSCRMKHLDKCLHQEVLAVRNRYLIATVIIGVITIVLVGLYAFKMIPPPSVEAAEIGVPITFVPMAFGLIGLYMLLEKTGNVFFSRLDWAVGLQRDCVVLSGTVIHFSSAAGGGLSITIQEKYDEARVLHLCADDTAAMKLQADDLLGKKATAYYYLEGDTMEIKHLILQPS